MMKLRGLPISVSFGWSFAWGAIPVPTLEFKLHSNFDVPSSSQELMAALTLKVAALEETVRKVTQQALQDATAREEVYQQKLGEIRKLYQEVEVRNKDLENTVNRLTKLEENYEDLLHLVWIFSEQVKRNIGYNNKTRIRGERPLDINEQQPITREDIGAVVITRDGTVGVIKDVYGKNLESVMVDFFPWKSAPPYTTSGIVLTRNDHRDPFYENPDQSKGLLRLLATFDYQRRELREKLKFE